MRHIDEEARAGLLQVDSADDYAEIIRQLPPVFWLRRELAVFPVEAGHV